MRHNMELVIHLSIVLMSS